VSEIIAASVAAMFVLMFLVGFALNVLTIVGA
jgi:hypothetical protein